MSRVWRAGPIFPVLTHLTHSLPACPLPCPSSCSSGLGCLPESCAGRTLLGRPSLTRPGAGLPACESAFD